jgi:general secretion pathway protein G
MYRPILDLVRPRLLAYLGQCRVEIAKLQAENFGSAPDLFSIDGGRSPTTQEGLEALALAPRGLELWNGPDVKGGRVSLDPWGHPHQCRSLLDHPPTDEIVALGADRRAGGTGAADRSHVER